MQQAWGCTRTTTFMHQGRNTTYSLHFPVRTSSIQQPPAFTPHSLRHWRRQKRAQLQQHCACSGKAGRQRTVKTRAALPSLPVDMKSLLTGDVIAATSSASFKLIFICVAVGQLLKADKLPKQTRSVLTQVAFHTMIPCMLFTKSAATLSANRSLKLIALPVAAILQVLAGTAIGWLAARLLIPEQVGPKPKRYAGWHPNNPPKSASAIAAATGVPEKAARPSTTPSETDRW